MPAPGPGSFTRFQRAAMTWPGTLLANLASSVARSCYQPDGPFVLSHSREKLFKNPHVQGRGCFGFGMELSADREPVGQTTFDRFDDSIWASRRNFKSWCNLIDGHVVHTVDAKFAISVDTVHQ